MATFPAPPPRTGPAVGPPPPFDPEVAVALAPMMAQLAVPMTPDMIPLVRQALGSAPRLTDEELRRGGAFTVDERAVPGPDGAPEVTLVVCRPAAVTGPTPLLYFVHGGGMIAGHERTDLGEALDWAQAVGAAVVSVRYRLAPETPHPGPVEDCYAGLTWVRDHAPELGADPARVVVAGMSAGGGLSAALALMCRDRGGPPLAGQLLICPMLDDRNDSLSAVQLEGVAAWDRHANGVGWGALLGGDAGAPEVSPYASPARAEDLSGLPPTYVDVGSVDTFRDEDVDYASRLWAAGGQAELHVWPGGCHGFELMVPHAPLAKSARRARLEWLQRVLAVGPGA